MNIEAFTQGILKILEKSIIFDKHELQVDIIINTVAGGFTRKKIYQENLYELHCLLEKIKPLPTNKRKITVREHRTNEKGHASDIMHEILDQANKDNKESRHLIISMGGDGTHLEVQRSFMDFSVIDQEKFTLLRLPCGTGNDGSDGRTITLSLGLLIDPVHITKQRVVKVTTASGRGPWYAFNIASIGLDAFVTHNTNKLKKYFPGDSYKFFLDIASVLYDKIYHIEPMSVSFFLNDKKIDSIERSLLICVIGCSGNRQYGSNKKILPDDNNICTVNQMPLKRKIALKELFSRGEHSGLPEVLLTTADRIEIDYAQKILVQMDGEAEHLDDGDFPIIMQLTSPLINILERDIPKII